MQSNNKKPKALNIRELLETGSYVIPIYQRNYAWTNAQISQLIQDVVDYRQKNIP